MIFNHLHHFNCSLCSYHRYAHNDGAMPDWFVDEEAEHLQPNLPITKEEVERIKAEQREIDARPIKKVIQAKARKQHKTVRKMDKLKQKAEAITENVTTTGWYFEFTRLTLQIVKRLTRLPHCTRRQSRRRRWAYFAWHLIC
jgi:hypothetical protein